jgi:hypothetical protein
VEAKLEKYCEEVLRCPKKFFLSAKRYLLRVFPVHAITRKRGTGIVDEPYDLNYW